MKSYLGESLYRLYIVILKLVLTIVPITLMAITFFNEFFQFDFAFSSLVGQITTLCIHLMVTLVQSVVMSLIWVTIVFFIMKLINFPVDKVNIDQLEQMGHLRQMKGNLISRTDTVLEAIGILILVWLFCFRPEMIASYHINNDQLTMLEPVFNIPILRTYYPMMLLIAGVGLFQCWMKFLFGKWSGKLVLFHLLYKLAGCVLVCVMLLNESLFNEAFFTSIFSFGRLDWTLDWYLFSRVLVVISIGLFLLDVIPSFVKSVKKN